jgi:hypothetical protein
MDADIKAGSLARIVCLLCAWATSAPALVQPGVLTEDVFRRFSDRVVKIEVQEVGSAAKASLGTGFYVSASGYLITNYHVISALVHDPDRYIAKALKEDKDEISLELLYIDVVHDLAILKAEEEVASFFSLVPVDPPQGLRVYSLGHPLDLGLNIVEGTYNGFLKHAFDKRINFTGSLNPGMSGGPAITGEGEVIGINVASAGEQVSFLVPVKWSIELLDLAASPDFEIPESFLELARKQVLDWQDRYISNLMAQPPPTVELDEFELPTRPASFFNCWADASRESDTPYETTDHRCSTDDYIYVSQELVSGRIWFHHRLLTSNQLNRFQFSSLYTDFFDTSYLGLGGSEKEVTLFQCHRGAFQQSSMKFKAVICLRRYKKLEGVYDAVLKAALVGRPLMGLETTLLLSGVSYENAEAMVQWYLSSISWIE